MENSFKTQETIYIWGAPKFNLRGGPEMLVKLAATLKNLGYNVKMFGSFQTKKYEISETFINYYGNIDTCSAEEVFLSVGSIIIIPELLIQDILSIDYFIKLSENNKLFIWMLSTGFTGIKNTTWDEIFYKLKPCKNIYFLCESRLAYDLLSFHGINRNKFMLQHGTHDIFIEKKPAKEKKKWVFYNGYKEESKAFVEEKLIPICPGIEFVGCLPERGFLTKEAIIDMMDESMVYIDYNRFIGRELMPREATLRNCVLLLSDNGCASYYEDYPIPDWYKIKNGSPSEYADKIRYILNNYDDCLSDMEFMAKKCANENSMFIEMIKKIF